MAQDPTDAAAIAKVMRDTWERPDAPLDVRPVATVEGYAIHKLTFCQNYTPSTGVFSE